MECVCWFHDLICYFRVIAGVCLVLYLSGVSSLMCVLDGVQQQCVNPGHPRVRLDSVIHCCLVFLPASLLPRPPCSFGHSLDFYKLHSSARIFSLFLFPSPEKQKQVEKKQPPLAALRATCNADPLSKLFCSPFPLLFPLSLPPSPSLTHTQLLLGKCCLIFSYSPPLLLPVL